MKQIYYWSPFISNIATIKAVINSAHSFNKFSNNKFESTIINACGEWNEYETELIDKKINLEKLNSSLKINNKITGFLKSRFTYIRIFISCFFPLINLIIKKKPDFLIVHLITSLPIFLFMLFNFKSKLIIRISGKIKMNFIRKTLWRFSKNKIFLICCPTKESQREILKLNIIHKSKVIFLPDPIIDINQVRKLKNQNLEQNFDGKKYFVSIGRFSKQKNHTLAIKCFKNICGMFKDVHLLIIGDGELNNNYKKLINKYNLNNKILLVSYKKNIYNFLKNSIGFVSTSLWEDPGFVMIEAAATNTFLISSDCPSGPREFISKDGGLLFVNDNLESLQKKIIEYLNMDLKTINNFKKNAKKRVINYTKLRHYNTLSYRLN